MSTTMPPTTPPATPASPDPGRTPRAGVPRWAWALIAVLAAIAIVAVTIAVTGRDNGDENTVAPPPASTGQAADGCLGGTGDLDQALITAQREAPLTAEGAAAFTATLRRWATLGPPPPNQAETAREVLAADATSAARKLSGTIDLEGTTGRLDFAQGRYYIESFDGRTALVSWTADAYGTDQGQALPAATVGGTAHLEAVDGAWHYQDQSLARPLGEIQRLGTRYAGGC